VYVCVVDFKQAFRLISHDKLWVTMMDMGYPLHLIDFLAKRYRKQLANVKVAGTLSEWFRVKKGVQQGCVLFPYLFSILAEMVMRETLDEFWGGLQIGQLIVTNCRYADDIILFATLETELQELVDHLDRFSHNTADPGILQAVSLQVTISHPPGGRLPLLCQACGYLPSCGASPPLGQYQVILLGDRGT